MGSIADDRLCEVEGGVTKKKTLEPFIMRTREMLRSPAFRVLSLSGHRFLARLEVELCNHGGNDNGRLPVPAEDFRDYGIDHDAVAPAQREVVALGFTEVTRRGRAGKAGQRRATEFRITYLPSFGKPPTNEWQNILSDTDAKRIATKARAKKATKRTGFRWHVLDPGKPDSPIRETRIDVDPGNPEPEPELLDPENPDLYLETSSHKAPTHTNPTTTTNPTRPTENENERELQAKDASG